MAVQALTMHEKEGMVWVGPLNQSGIEPAIFYEWSMGPADLNKSLYEKKQMSQGDRWGAV